MNIGPADANDLYAVAMLKKQQENANTNGNLNLNSNSSAKPSPRRTPRKPW